MYIALSVWNNVLDLFQRNYTILHRRNTFLLQDTLPPRELLQSLYEAIRFLKDPHGTAGSLVPTAGESAACSGIFRLLSSCRGEMGGAEMMNAFHVSGQENKQYITMSTCRNNKIIEA